MKENKCYHYSDKTRITLLCFTIGSGFIGYRERNKNVISLRHHVFS
jgi:hypothetical protein